MEPDRYQLLKRLEKDLQGLGEVEFNPGGSLKLMANLLCYMSQKIGENTMKTHIQSRVHGRAPHGKHPYGAGPFSDCH